jgi:hypothetical protein
MLPLESSAIVRGFTRCDCFTEAWEVLEDELSLPLHGWIDFDSNAMTTTLDEDQQHLDEEAARRRLEVKERLIHRARGIGSIVSRHLYQEEPTAALAAIDKLRAMGQIVNEAGLKPSELDMPWEKLVRGAAMCESERRNVKCHLGKPSNVLALAAIRSYASHNLQAALIIEIYCTFIAQNMETNVTIHQQKRVLLVGEKGI